MSVESEDILLKSALAEVENQLGWGSGSLWTTQDFESLSEKISEATGTHLSVATLKRLWGKVRYESKPTAATLNTLVQFIGYENWRVFCQKNNHESEMLNHGKEEVKQLTFNKRKITFWLSFASLIVLVFIFFFSGSKKETTFPIVNDSIFSFHTTMMVSQGVPNSIIFNYDAAAAKVQDTIYIQQSWDERLRTQVSLQDKVHHSIYYYPGFFQAKLVVNGRIVKQQDLFIKTKGWLPLVESDQVPVYFNEAEALHKDDGMHLTISQLKENNISLNPVAPWVSYFNIREFGDLRIDNFTFETRLKNKYSEGSGVCQHTEIHILLEGGAIIIPLSIKGCVSELGLYDAKGKKEDPSGLGVDFSDYVNVVLQVRDKQGQLIINDKPVYDLDLDITPIRIVGLRYRFQGTGSVQSVLLKDSQGEPVYSENFVNNKPL